MIKYYNKELSYKCREDDLKPYSENTVNLIQKMKRLSFLEGKHQVNEFEGAIYEENLIVKNELQVHNMFKIQNEYYICISKRLINKLLIISNNIIKQKQKEMNQEEANEILRIMNKI